MKPFAPTRINAPRLRIAAACGLTALLFSAPAHAQFGDLLKKALHGKNHDRTQDGKAGELNALPPYSGPKRRLGVEDLELKVSATTTYTPTPSDGGTTTTSLSIPPPADFGTGLTEMLMTELMKSNRFILLERKSFTDVTAEQTLSGSAGFNPDAAVKGGSLLGAAYFIKGVIPIPAPARTAAAFRGM